MHIWPFFRVASFMMVVPVIGTNLVPTRLRLGLAVMFTLVIVPHIPAGPALDPLSLQSVTISLHQIATGIFLGFAVQFLFQLFIVSGQVIAMQMGLGFASMVDPINGISITGLSQIYLLMTTLAFLSMNGHLVMFDTLAESFRWMPIGEGLLTATHWSALANRVSWMFASGLMVALPAVTAMLVVTLSLGVMTRAAPQMNIFSIGFPLSVVLGVFVFWVNLNAFLPQFELLSRETFDFLNESIGAP